MERPPLPLPTIGNSIWTSLARKRSRYRAPFHPVGKPIRLLESLSDLLLIVEYLSEICVNANTRPSPSSLCRHRVALRRFSCRLAATATGRLLFVLVILAHARRRVAHVAVTEHPTPAWTSQQ